jgi:putative colanic acid biosynthesis acetyltransferase WcaF
MKIDLSKFDHSKIKRKKSTFIRGSWLIVQSIFFDTSFPWPYKIKRLILRCFGAKIGKNGTLRSRLYIHSPWMLDIGDNCWIGDGCKLLSVEKITLEDNVALAHEVYLAAGGHDISSASMAPKNKPIYIKSGSWLASTCFIAGGVTIGKNVVVSGGAVVFKDVEDNKIVSGNPAHIVSDRIIDAE